MSTAEGALLRASIDTTYRLPDAKHSSLDPLLTAHVRSAATIVKTRHKLQANSGEFRS
jgi:hypothetical protein